VSAIYQLPFGSNRQYLSGMNRFEDAVFRRMGDQHGSRCGRRGPYLTPTTSPSFDTANVNLVFRGAALRPDCVGNPIPANRSLSSYYDINAFNPIPGTGRIGTARLAVSWGRGTAAVAGGLSKTFQLRESMRMRFEGDVHEPAESFRTSRRLR